MVDQKKSLKTPDEVITLNKTKEGNKGKLAAGRIRILNYLL